MSFQPLPPHLRDLYEAQATACLEAAEQWHEALRGLAQRLAGSREAGHDIFSEACLRCHDTIQRRGFQGDGYRWYLLATIRNLHYERSGRPRTVALPAGWEPVAPAEPACDVYQQLAEQLAEQVAAEARARFTDQERIWLRLHADGWSAQEIVRMTGSDCGREWVRKRLVKMKEQLRELFRPNWEALVG